MKIGQSAGKDYAYLLGVYLGDGCVTRDKSTNSGPGVKYYPVFRLNAIDEDFVAATEAALQKFTDRPINICKHSVKASKKPNFSLRCGDPEICENLVSVTDAKKVIPDFVHNWPLDCRKAFIVGLMDSEGFVAANSNPTNRRFYMGYKSCDPWVPEFVKIMQSVGIRIGKIGVEKPRKEGYKTPVRFAIKMQSWIDAGMSFNIRRKQDRVELWAEAGAYERRAKNPRRSTSETNMPDAA